MFELASDKLLTASAVMAIEPVINPAINFEIHKIILHKIPVIPLIVPLFVLGFSQSDKNLFMMKFVKKSLPEDLLLFKYM